MDQQAETLTNSIESARQHDPLLLPYLDSEDDVESKELASQLICRHAKPIIRAVVFRKLNATLNRSHDYQEIDDISGEVVLELLEVLQQLRSNPGARPLLDFRGYVAAIAYRASSEYLRRKHPRRSSLRGKLRYLLTRSSEFALWKNEEGRWVCGFAAWRDRSNAVRPYPFAEAENSELSPARDFDPTLTPVELLAAIFDQMARPISFEDLVGLVSDAWGIEDHAPESDTKPLERIPDLRVNIATEVEQRIYLQRVWVEIERLPPRQRAALLLNLSDSSNRGVIVLLPVIGIASFDEIAAALEMTPERLAEMWNELPLDDITIAGLLGITRQQVINLRKAARERLTRRTRAFGKSA